MSKISFRKIVGLLVIFGCGTVWAQTASDVQINDAVAQSAGNFDSMNLTYLTSMGMQQKAWNDPMQHMGEGQLKPGYSKYMWTPDVVLPVRLREGMMTLINLPTWELIEKVHIGSPESFGGEIAAPNSLLLYADPNYIGVDSNLIIFGRSGNRYVFYLRSETYNTDRITNSVIDVLVGPQYTPVEDGGKMVSNEGASTVVGVNRSGAQQSSTTNLDKWTGTVPFEPENFRFDIDVFLPNPSDISIAPERVWRDDIFTYIDFGKKALSMKERPVVNLLVQGSEVPVGSRTVGEYSRMIVVEGIGDMVLRNGQKIVCLKMRRTPTAGFERINQVKANEYQNKLPTNSGNMGGQYSDPYATVDTNQYINRPIYANNVQYANNLSSIPNMGMNSGQPTSDVRSVLNEMTMAQKTGSSAIIPMETIAVELAKGTDIRELEARWNEIYQSNTDLLSGYHSYFSIDTIAEGGAPELFRLRVGPVKDVMTGDALCAKLSRSGVACSVVRTG